ncbi:hypothetical protein LZC95_50255 [Pendulispora brunnea]|uniref:Uncharacterized protein n=1 Tax=Pendulispora brunnea TaxID=2905690 RepID=A0ABZ2K7E5_9BACT
MLRGLRVALALGISCVVGCSETTVNNYGPPDSSDSGVDAQPPGEGPLDGGNAHDGAVDVPRDAGGDAHQPGADAGLDADSGPTTAFSGAPAFAGGLGPSARSSNHQFTTGNNPAGQPCNNCHGSIASEFVASGTVWNSANADVGVAGAEVVLRLPNGSHVILHTDADGNFFLRPTFALPEIPRGALAGVRTASQQVTKKDVLDTGQANCMLACHSSRPMHVP